MKIYTVTEINNYIKLLLLKDNVLSCVKISGEVSNCKYHSSGHIYFTLKDSSGQLACVMFAGKRISGLKFQLKEGMSVVVSGEITVYERDGKYQLYADRIEQTGIGELFEKYEKLKSRLLAEGLFDEEHKKPIPAYIKTLGVITASTGAALQDIINITRRRNPYVKIIVYPAQVQGQGAAATLIKGIHEMEKVRPDVVIIGRGGGSFEDLFEFNDEALARAIYDCDIPVISAVGHEVDFSICDYVSDLRAPTPSAAAELAVYEFRAVEAMLIDHHSALLKNLLNKIDSAKLRTERYAELLSRITVAVARDRAKAEQYRLMIGRLSPQSIVNNQRFRADKLKDRLDNDLKAKLTEAKHRLSVAATALDSISPVKSLKRGYSYTTDMTGHNINSVSKVKAGDRIGINVTDGRIEAEVLSTINNGE